ncbi:MAG: S41 family peptidase, partial [Candidatus Latescibacteria bacterium]|nr:S41 family peptidase [Candidatus Latescibacterota bacterium]
SASASEIVAGAIQDYDRGLVVGETTFGKGLVQKEFPLDNGGAVLLTIARYFTPSDRPIQRPYSRDRASYVEAAHDGIDPNVDPDSTLAKPVYYTRILRRKVFGSGGITPDVRLERDSLNAFERRLGRRHFFEFANLHAAEITRDFDDFEAYFRKYRPRRREISMFKRFLRSRDVEFTEREFRGAGDLVQREIRRQVAQIRWGTEAAGRVLVDEDPQVTRAIGAFRRAEALLADRASHYDGNQSRTPPAPGRRFERAR